MTNIRSVIVRAEKILVMPLLAVLIGCDTGSTAKVGIVDIDRVASELGWDKDWQQEQARETEGIRALADQINQIQKELSEKLGESPSDEDQAKANQEMLEARQKFVVARSRANQRLKVMRMDLLRKVSEEAQSHIGTLAAQKGLTLVLKRGDYIMAAQPAHDITRDVVAQMASTPPYTSQSDSTEDSPAPPAQTPPAETPVPDAEVAPTDAAP